MAFRLSDYGYRETASTAVRRQSLGRAVQAVGYQSAYDALTARLGRRSGYRKKRVRADRNWLKRRMGSVGVSVR